MSRGAISPPPPPRACSPGGWLAFEANAKWDAWNGVKGKSKEAAMTEYIAEIERQQREYA
jgi:acyl-CoA-binding protein